VHSKKLILANNVIYTFVFAALLTLIPLYLIEKNISLESIGLILSILPLTSLSVRLFLGTLADEIGEKKVLIIQSLAMFVSPIIYVIANSPIIFALGKIIEGTRDSAFWAVSRTEIIHSYGIKSAEKSLAMFGGARILSDATGRLVIGLAIAYAGFQNSLLALSALGLILFFLFLKQRRINHNKFNIKHSISRLTKKRSREFWFVSFGLTFLAAATGLFFVFLAPLFMLQGLNMGYELIGGALAIMLLITGIFTLIKLYLKIPVRILSIMTVLFMASAFVLLPLVPSAFWILIIIFAIGHGSASILYEEILGNATKKSKDLSTDFGVIHVPLRIAEFISFALAGFVVSNFGFAPLFFACAISITIFGLFSLFYFSDNRHQIS
jgi:predicted MFS family arabinose efflux permease